MSENQRRSFRVEPDAELEAELFHQGRVAPCTVENLSAGGARVVTTVEMQVGDRCTLGVRIMPSQSGGAGRPYVSFHLEVLEVEDAPEGEHAYRLQGVAGPGAPEYEAATKLVFEQQQRIRARSSHTTPASPMVSDRERRHKLRFLLRGRFGRGSTRPGS